MASLFNTRISDTYVSIIKSIDNAVISSTLKQLSDGSGNGLGIYVNTSGDFKVSGILEFGSLKDTAESITITKFVDEADGIANNDNDTTIPTSAAVKDYVDTQITAEDLDFAGDTGSGSVDLDSQVLTISGTTNEIETSASGQTLTVGLPTNVTISGETSVGSLKTSGVYYFNGNTISHLSNSDLIFGFKSTTGFRVSFNAGTTDELLIENGSITGEVILDEDNMASDSATKLATQQSIKAYVDSQVGANNELSEVLANGNTTGGTNISVSSGDNITFADSSQALFGAGSDLKILHNGTDSYIQNFTGTLQIQNQSDDKDILLRSDDGSGGIETYFYLDGSTNLNRFAVNARWDDNIQAQFGASADLQIYHDGSDSYIDEGGTGGLKLESNSFIDLQTSNGGAFTGRFINGGAVELYYSGSKKFITTSTGVSVTGSATVSSDLILSDYGSGTHTGTATQRLGVDSSGNVIEIPIGAGAVDGSGTAGVLTKWEDSNTITDSIMSETTGTITITGPSVSGNLQINGSSGSNNKIYGNNVGILIYQADTENNGANSSHRWQIDGSEKMRLDSSGRLGLGVSSPAYNLHVEDSGDSEIVTRTTSNTNSAYFVTWNNNASSGNNMQLRSYGAGQTGTVLGNSISKANMLWSSGDSLMAIGTIGSTPLIFGTGNAERLRLDSSGRLGLKTSSPTYEFGIGDGTTERFAIDIGSVGADDVSLMGNNRNVSIDASGPGSRVIKFKTGTSAYSGSERMRIDSSGIVKIFTTGGTSEKTYSAAAGLQLYSQQSDAGSPYTKTSDIVANGDGTVPSELRMFTKANGDSSPSERMRIDSSGTLIIKNDSSTTYGPTLQFDSQPKATWDVGDVVGEIDFFTSDTSGNAPYSAGFIKLLNETGAGTLPSGGLSFGTATYNASGGATERMRITSGGLVGIGGSPSYILDVITTGSRARFKANSGNADIELSSIAGRDWLISSITDGSLRFYDEDASSERMRITSGGEFLIGTTSTSVSNNGFVHFSTGRFSCTQTSEVVGIINRRGTDGEAIRFLKADTDVGSIDVTTTATSYNTSSDYRLKEDLQDFNALEIASKIKMYDFKWKADDSRSYGVMAHELEEVLPQAVSGEKDAEEMQGVDYSKLVPILLKSIQELEARVKELENK